MKFPRNNSRLQPLLEDRGTSFLEEGFTDIPDGLEKVPLCEDGEDSKLVRKAVHRHFLGRKCECILIDWQQKRKHEMLIAQGDVPNETIYTWKAKTSLFVTLHYPVWRTTCVTFNDTGETYYTHRNWGIRETCPLHSQFLGQVIMDNVEKGDITPVIMVFDILKDGDKDVSHLPASERYQLLRAFSMHIVTGDIQLQWAGEKATTIQFCYGDSDNLPHKVDYVFGLRDHDPRTIHKIPRPGIK